MCPGEMLPRGEARVAGRPRLAPVTIRARVARLALIGCCALELAAGCGPAARRSGERSAGTSAHGEEIQLAYSRGTAALAAGRYGDAIPDLRAVLRARPADLVVRYNLGVTLLRLRSWQDAADVLAAADVTALRRRTLPRGAVVPAAADADYLHALGSALQELGERAKALGCFDAALALDGNHLKSRYARALVLEEQGNLQRAREAWLDYLQRDPAGAWSDAARRHLSAIEDQLRTSARQHRGKR